MPGHYRWHWGLFVYVYLVRAGGVGPADRAKIRVLVGDPDHMWSWSEKPAPPVSEEVGPAAKAAEQAVAEKTAEEQAVASRAKAEAHVQKATAARFDALNAAWSSRRVLPVGRSKWQRSRR
eukprot:COSAG02_NODE_579_length_20073_cov_2118.572745_5_plen_121_part_00